MSDGDDRSGRSHEIREITVRPLPPPMSRGPLEQSVRVGFGLAALVLEVALRALAGPDTHPSRTRGVLDAGMGAGWAAARAGTRVSTTALAVATPAVRATLHPPLLPRPLHLGTALDALTDRWRTDRAELALEATRASAASVPATVEAVASMVDLDLLVTTILDRLDLDRLVQHLLKRLDLDEAVRQALEELDLTPIVSEAVRRMDLQAVATEAIGELRMDEVIAQSLDQVDLTTLVTERVRLDDVVNSALDDLDLTALVMERVDLVSIADYVVDAIDLPGIVRDSTGSIAAESIQGVRLQAANADRMLARLADRLTLRGGRARKLDAPGDPEMSTSPEEP